MNLRNRLTLITTLVFGIVFMVASSVVYFFYLRSSERIIFNDLEQRSLLTALFYLEEDELTQKEHSEIEQQFLESNLNTIVRIYDEYNIIKYGKKSPDSKIDNKVLDEIRKSKKSNFKSQEYYYSGIFYPDNQGDFVVVIKEDNSFFKEQANGLLLIICVVFIVGLLTIFALSRAISHIAYKPVGEVIEQVKQLDLNSMESLIESPKTNDELEELVNTFNNLLSRLSDSFAVQKNFVNYVSHEFKTPLAAISGSLEVFAQRERSHEEYKGVVKDALKNVYQIEDILNTLLMVSGIKNSKSKKESIRVDELLWEIVDRLALLYPASKPVIQLNVGAEKNKLLTVRADKTELQLALFNIIENAIKYSEGTAVSILIQEKNKKLQLQVVDNGKGIPEADLENITKPFYRGVNAEKIKGSGIGLSLASIILKQNKIGIAFQSKEAIGTTVTLLFP